MSQEDAARKQAAAPKKKAARKKQKLLASVSATNTDDVIGDSSGQDGGTKKMYFERQAHNFPATTDGGGANDSDHDDAAAGPSSSEASWDIDAIINSSSATTQVTAIAPAPNIVSDLQASPTKKQKLSASTGAITKKNTKLRRTTVVVKVHASPGFLGFILKPKKHNRAVTIRKIYKACVVKDQIQVGDQLIGVDHDYFLMGDLVQFIKSKQSNPVRILTFQRYRSVPTANEEYFFIRVIPPEEESTQCDRKNCHGKNCSQKVIASWASNLNPGYESL